MKISVVIPALNEENYLPRALKALNQQKRKADEIIVVDNASTDNTSKVANALGARVVYEPVKGMTPARQRGFKEAKGDIIARTDADSQAPENWLEEIEKTFQKNPDAVAVTGPVEFYSESVIIKKLFTFGTNTYLSWGHRWVGHPLLQGFNYAVRKDIITMIQPTMDDSLVHEDIDLSCRIAKIGKIIINKQMIMCSSSRRLEHNPGSLLIEYPYRFLTTIRLHHPYYVMKHTVKS